MMYNQSWGMIGFGGGWASLVSLVTTALVWMTLILVIMTLLRWLKKNP